MFIFLFQLPDNVNTLIAKVETAVCRHFGNSHASQYASELFSRPTSDHYVRTGQQCCSQCPRDTKLVQ